VKVAVIDIEMGGWSPRDNSLTGLTVLRGELAERPWDPAGQTGIGIEFIPVELTQILVMPEPGTVIAPTT